MLRCVDLSRGLLETPDPTGNALMQLKMTALMSTRLCVRGGPGGRGGAAAHQVPLTAPPAIPFQKQLTSWVRRPGDSLELSPERLAEAMDSGQVRTTGWGRGMVGGDCRGSRHQPAECSKYLTIYLYFPGLELSE